MEHDAAIGGTESLAQSDFASALGDGDEHDVDDADGAERKRDQTDGAKEFVHGIEDGTHQLRLLDGIPAFERVFIVIVEVVIAGNDAARLILGEQVFVGDAGLIVDQGNRVVGLFALEREVAAHNLEGNVGAGIGGVVVAPADAFQRADDLEAIIVEQNERAHGGASRKKVARHLIAENDDVAFLRFVEVVKPASQLQREKADSVVLRFGAGELTAGAGEFADGVHVVGGENGGDGPNVGRLFADVEVVLIGEPVLAGGVHAARNSRSAAGEKKHDVFAVLRKTALVAGSEALAEADQQQQGADTPGDAEHGEERAEFVRPEGAENLRENVDHRLHGVDNSRCWLLALSGRLFTTRFWPLLLPAFTSLVLSIASRWRRVHCQVPALLRTDSA